MGPLTRFVREVVRSGPRLEPDDSLLDAFVERRDADAFAAMVERHGPMVWAVCRRAVWHTADAEDAFQAVFLVLAKKAHAVRPRRMLAGWLHGVAANVCKKARAAAARRGTRERPLGDLDVPARPSVDADPFDGPALDEAIASLPASLREPLVLCELEGVTRKDAAVRLAIPEGTVASRVARAKARLARRLAAPSLTAAAWAGFAPSATCAPAAPDLFSRTIDAVLGAGSFTPAAAHAAALAHEVVTEMTLQKFKMGALLTAGAAGLAVTAGVRLDTPAPAMAAPAPPPKQSTVSGTDLAAKVLRPSDELNLRLLRSEAVRKELALSDEDATKVKEATAKVDEVFREKMGLQFGVRNGAINVQNVPGGIAIQAVPAVPALPAGGAVMPVQGQPLPVGGAAIPVQGQALPAAGAVMPAMPAMPIGGGGRVMFGSTSTKAFNADEIQDELFGPKSEFAKTVTPMVTESRVRRLRQLDLAATGVSAFSNRRVVRLLGLTESQEDEIEAIQKKFRTDTRDTWFDPKKFGELQDVAVAACVKLLSTDQKDLWTACVGPAVPAADLLAATQPLTPMSVMTTTK